MTNWLGRGCVGRGTRGKKDAEKNGWSASVTTFSRHVWLTIRKSLMSVIFPPAILGPEMAAPILWVPGSFVFFLQENLHAHKIPRFRAGVLGFIGEGGGWKCQFYFLVNLILIKLVRISGFSSLFLAIAAFSATFCQRVLQTLRSLRKERKTQKSSLI